MVLRFQTRLTLVMAILVTATLIVMAVLVVTTVVGVIIDQNQKVARTVTELATRNIGYGLTLPDRVMDRIGEQMVVSALLTAELVAVAERDAELPPERISAILQNVIDRSREATGYNLVDEFWVTDESGRAYINTMGREFVFSENSEAMPQASAFWKLLEPEAKPVIQEFQKREIDDRRFTYVGVPGVDQPRIVQIGAGERLVGSITSEFSVQGIVDRFALDVDFEDIMVVDVNGAILASAGALGAVSEADVKAFCISLFDSPEQRFAIGRFGSYFGVVSRLPDSPTGEPRALFMLHNTDALTRQLRGAILFFAVLSLVMLAVAVLLSMLLSRSLSRPIKELLRGVREFGKGNFRRRVALHTGDEIQVLGDAFNGMAASLEDHMERLEAETRRRERLESELNIAAQLQRSLLPEDPPVVDGLDVVGWSEPAREVGGDFYDFIPMPSGRLGIAIGDATDKGLPAALLIRQCWAVFRAFSEESESPAELLARTNQALWHQVGSTGRFVTLFFMVVDPREGVLRYSMAGHNPPILLGQDPARRRLFTCDMGLPLGIERQCEFGEVTVDLQPSDTILLYSDGITEALGPNDILYGDRRLQATLASVVQTPLVEVIDSVRRDVEVHLSGRVHSDDMTLVGVRFRANG